MKRTFLLPTVFFALASVATAQRTNDPNARHHRTEVSPKAPNVTVVPRHRAYTTGAHKTAKSASVNAQLNQLERQTATLGTTSRGRD